MSNKGELPVLAGTLLLELAWSMSYMFMAFETYAQAGFYAYALIRSLPSLAYFLGSRFLGFLSDSSGMKRPFFLLGSISTVTSLSAMAFLPIDLWIPVISLWYFLSAYEPVMIAYLSAEMEAGTASGEYYAASELGFTLGTAIGGMLADALGIRNVLILAAFVSLPSLPLFMLAKDGPYRSLDIKGALKRTIQLKFPGRTKEYVPMFLTASLSISVFYVAFSIKVFEASGRSNSLMGLLIAAAGLLGTLTGPVYGKLTDRLGGMRSFLVSCLVYSTYFSIAAFIEGLTLLALLMVIPIFPFHYSSRNALAMELAPEEKASAVSVPSSLGSISEAVGNYVGGTLMGLLGLTETMIAGSILSLAAGAMIRLRGRKGEGGDPEVRA
ncbi:MAG: MFS transporter [Candidatus Korarchaeota archaeon]|nr:MFS transporter [Candidatus Korarchaeota archaeon]